MGEQDGNSVTCSEAITIIRLGDSDGMDRGRTVSVVINGEVLGSMKFESPGVAEGLDGGVYERERHQK